MAKSRSVFTAYLLWLLFGWFGAHLFYLGRVEHGFLTLTTFGGFLIGWLRDAFKIPKYVREWGKEEFRDKKPKISIFRGFIAVVVGALYGSLFRGAYASYLGLKFPIQHVSVATAAAGIAFGVYLVANTGRQSSPFARILVASLICTQLCVSSFEHPIVFSSLIVVIYAFAIRTWKVPNQPKKKKFILWCLVHYLTWSVLILEAELDVNGEKMKVKSALYNIGRECRQGVRFIFEALKESNFEWEKFATKMDVTGYRRSLSVLGATPQSTEEDVKKLYKALARKYHPDRCERSATMTHDSCREKFQEIQEAYEIVKKSFAGSKVSK